MHLLSAKSGTASLRDDSTATFSAIVPQNSASSSFPVYAWTKLQGEGFMATLNQTKPVTETSLKLGDAAPAAGRNVSMDTYRGLVMLLMMAEVLQLSRVSAAYPTSLFWKVLAFNQTHVDWAGCSLHDTIQPGFSFLVGVALPFSIASRLAKGATFGKLFAHALWRSLLLIALGVFLRSMHSTQTYFTFEDTLTQIGLGYPLLFLLGFRPARWQWWALGVILFGYWLAWALYPVPGPGFFAHWAKNSNLGHAFDMWFLNLFPR